MRGRRRVGRPDSKGAGIGLFCGPSPRLGVAAKFLEIAILATRRPEKITPPLDLDAPAKFVFESQESA